MEGMPARGKGVRFGVRGLRFGGVRGERRGAGEGENGGSNTGKRAPDFVDLSTLGIKETAVSSPIRSSKRVACKKAPPTVSVVPFSGSTRGGTRTHKSLRTTDFE